MSLEMAGHRCHIVVLFFVNPGKIVYLVGLAKCIERGAKRKKVWLKFFLLFPLPMIEGLNGKDCYWLEYFVNLHMDALIVYPENKEQLTALKAVMKAMKISFEQQPQQYPDHVIAGVKRSLKQAEEGDLSRYTDIKDMLGLA